MADIIRVADATKVIRGRTVLDHVTFDLERGGVYGFLGVNGSGKSMLFRAISGLIHLTSGTIEVFGEQVGKGVDFPSNMGLCFESSGFWDEKTGLQNLFYLASIRGVVSNKETECALERVGLDPRMYAPSLPTAWACVSASPSHRPSWRRRSCSSWTSLRTPSTLMASR